MPADMSASFRRCAWFPDILFGFRIIAGFRITFFGFQIMLGFRIVVLVSESSFWFPKKPQAWGRALSPLYALGVVFEQALSISSCV